MHLSLISLLALSYFIQGWEGLPGQALFVYLKNILGLSPTTIMYLGAFTGLAWIVKPLWGSLIDQHKSKAWWYALGLALSCGVALLLGFWSLPLWILLIGFSIQSCCASIRDVSVDGIMICCGKETGETSKLQAIQWIAILLAGLLTGIFGGALAQNVSYKAGFLCLVPVYMLAGGVLCWFQKGTRSNTAGATRGKETGAMSLLTNTPFLWACLFIFLYKFSPSFGTPLSFMMRDQFGWSETFIGLMGSISSVLSLLGAVIYYKFSKGLTFYKLLPYIIILNCCSCLGYLHYTPQTALLYMLIYPGLDMISHLVFMGFLANSAVPGLEATSFATLCSINNLAGTVSSLTGAWLLPILGVPGVIITAAILPLSCIFCIKNIFKRDRLGI